MKNEYLYKVTKENYNNVVSMYQMILKMKHVAQKR